MSDIHKSFPDQAIGKPVVNLKYDSRFMRDISYKGLSQRRNLVW
jgi:hypothetical protein